MELKIRYISNHKFLQEQLQLVISLENGTSCLELPYCFCHTNPHKPITILRSGRVMSSCFKTKLAVFEHLQLFQKVCCLSSSIQKIERESYRYKNLKQQIPNARACPSLEHGSKFIPSTCNFKKKLLQSRGPLFWWNFAFK